MWAVYAIIGVLGDNSSPLGCPGPSTTRDNEMSFGVNRFLIVFFYIFVVFSNFYLF